MRPAARRAAKKWNYVGFMAHSVSELQVITHAKNLCSYIFTITQKSPKQFRFSLIGRMQDYTWFALWYLDELDRYVKEIRHIKYYTRYMDDFILIHSSKEYLLETRHGMEKILKRAGLTFNAKTQIFPISHGVEYLGWRFYLTDTGKVVRRLKKHSKVRMQHRLKKLSSQITKGEIDLVRAKAVENSYWAHLEHGDTWRLRQKSFAGILL